MLNLFSGYGFVNHLKGEIHCDPSNLKPFYVWNASGIGINYMKILRDCIWVDRKVVSDVHLARYGLVGMH